jgi:hypothetical protein
LGGWGRAWELAEVPQQHEDFCVVMAIAPSVVQERGHSLNSVLDYESSVFKSRCNTLVVRAGSVTVAALGICHDVPEQFRLSFLVLFRTDFPGSVAPLQDFHRVDAGLTSGNRRRVREQKSDHGNPEYPPEQMHPKVMIHFSYSFLENH